MELDKIDLKILSVLQREARIRNAQLAARVNLSQSACLARVKRLEEAGYIRGYAALVDLEKLGQSVTVFAAIRLEGSGKGHQDKFEKNPEGDFGGGGMSRGQRHGGLSCALRLPRHRSLP